MASLHDSLQMGKGSPEELLGVNPEDVPCYVAETQPGDLVCFDVILRTCFLRFVRLRAVTPRNAQHRCKHSAFGGGPRRRMFTTNWYARTDQSAAHRTAAKLTNGLPRKKGEDGTFTAIGRTWRDPHPRGWFESSPPERQAIVRAHRELWAECVRECEEAPDGEAEWGACRKRFLRSSLIAAELEEGT